MVSSGQSGDATLIRSGPHKITVDTAGTPKVAGYTVGNVTLSFDPAVRQVFCNEWGGSPVDLHVTGIVIGFSFTMLERSIKIFDIAFNGLYPGTGVANARGLGRAGVISAQTRGKDLLLHPLREGASTARDITLRKVMLLPTGSRELSDQDSEMTPVNGICVVDDTQVDGQVLALIRESSAGA